MLEIFAPFLNCDYRRCEEEEKQEGEKILQFIFSSTHTRSLTLFFNCISTFKFSFLLHESPRGSDKKLKKKSGEKKKCFSQNKNIFFLLLFRGLSEFFFIFSAVATFCFSRVFPPIFPRICNFMKSAFSKSKQTDLEFCDLRVGKINTEKKGKAKKRKNAN